METAIFETFSQFGIAGMILGVLLAVILLHSKTIKSIGEDHKTAAKQWRESFDAHSRQSDIRQAETNKVLRAMTKVIAKKK